MVDEHEAEELENMQAMMSISEVYKERMEEEIQDAREQLRNRDQQLRVRDQNATRLETELQDTQEQLNAARKRAQEQEIAAYIGAGIRFGADLDVLREDVISKYGIGHAEAVALIEKAQSKQSPLD